MQLKSIKLNNFRQYIDERIDFSMDNIKNITLVVGDTGAGKSTLENAFRFVLYGSTGFETILLNQIVAKKMENMETSYVSVTLEIKQKENFYTIKREIEYLKNNVNSFSKKSQKLDVWKIEKGNHIKLADDVAFKFVKNLIPKELSDYFFIDGEKIDKMKMELESGKSEDFSVVVRSVLGLNYLEQSINHLKNLRTIYNKEIDKNGSKDLIDNTKRINEIEIKIAELEGLINNETKELNFYKDESKKYDSLIKNYHEAATIQTRYQTLTQDIENKNNEINNYTDLITRNLSNSFVNYISIPLMQKAKKILSNVEKVDLGIPDIQLSTLEYLLKNEKCICGSSLSKGGKLYEHILDLIKYVPPQSLGSSINHFLSDLDLKKDLSADHYIKISDYYKQRRRAKDAKNSLEEQKHKASDVLFEINEVLENKKKFDEAEREQKRHELNLNKINQDLGAQIFLLEQDKKRREELIATTKINNKVKEYLDYTEFILKSIVKYYDQKEEKIREVLETKVNEFIVKIYKEGLLIDIDKKYNIVTSVAASEKGSKIEISTGQIYIVIFSFVASVIFLARTSDNFIDINEEETTKEYFPLVMDAPFSTLNDWVINNLFSVLPNVAEQIVIFVNNKDIESSKDLIIDKVGKMYELIPSIDLLNTKVMEISNV